MAISDLFVSDRFQEEHPAKHIQAELEDDYKECSPAGLTGDQKEEIIAQAWQTGEGRKSLSQAMVEPIRRSLEYQAVGRKSLLIDELPKGSDARYELTEGKVAHILVEKEKDPFEVSGEEHITVPPFTIEAFPTISLKEIKARGFYIVDGAQIKAKEEIQKEEDGLIIKTLIAAARQSDNVIYQPGYTTIPPSALQVAFQMIARNGEFPLKVLMRAEDWEKIAWTWSRDLVDTATCREALTSNLVGHIRMADVHTTQQLPKGNIIVTASPDRVGVMPIYEDIQVESCDRCDKIVKGEQRLGWRIWEEIGIGVINSDLVALIETLNGEKSQ